MIEKLYKFIKKSPGLLAIFLLWLIFGYQYFINGLLPFPSKYLVSSFPPWNSSYAMPVKNPAMPDVITQILPWKKLTIDAFKNGEIPLWNPYSFSGTVHAANFQSAVFSPLNTLFLIMDFMDAWSFLILFQPLLAGLFTYFYLRTLNKSEAASVFGGISFMFCGFLTGWMAYGTLGYAALAFPLILALIEKTISDRKNQFRYMFFISMALMFSFLSGHFQISLYVIIFSYIYLVLRSYQIKSWKFLLTGSFYIIIGLFLSSIQIIPALEAFLKSSRSASVIKGEIIPWSYFLTFLAPDIYGNPVTGNNWFGHYAEWGGYAGVGAVIFTILALTNKIAGFKKIFLFLFILLIFLAYESPLIEMVYLLKVPVLSASAASRIIFLASFSLAVLASYGFDEFMNGSEKLIKQNRYFPIILVMLIITVWVLAGSGIVIDSVHFGQSARNLILPTVLFVFYFIVCLLVFIKPDIRKKPLIIYILIVLASSDMLRFSLKWMPFEPRQYAFPQNGLITFLKANANINRVFGNIGNEVGSYFQFQLIEGYDAVHKKVYKDFLNLVADGQAVDRGRSVALLDKRAKYRKDALRLMGVKYFVHKIGDGRSDWAYPVWEYDSNRFKVVYDDGIYQVYEDYDALPRAFLADDYLLADKDIEAISLLFNSKVDYAKTLILKNDPEFKPEPGPGISEIIKYSLGYVAVKTSSTSPKLLFLSDVYDNGWKTYIDGKEVHLHEANMVFRAVSVSAGDHLVEFKYKPLSFQYGILLTLSTMVFIVFINTLKVRI